jgi:hypothetical protein
LALLSHLGDVSFIAEFGGCFGKQRYSAFSERARRAVAYHDERFLSGRNSKAVPAPDAFNLFELLNMLAADDDVTLLLDHHDFRYNYMSLGRDAVPGELKFMADPQPNGYSISDLTFNQERPNISLLVKKTGYVDLSEALLSASAHVRNALPVKFPTFIFRNYNIVRDGIVNVPKLPMLLSKEILTKLQEVVAKNDRYAFFNYYQDPATDTTVLNIDRLPVVNRKMTTAVSAEEFLQLEFKLAKAKAAQKVFNHYQKEIAPKVSKGYAVVYGTEAAAWLSDHGLTDYNGFSPKETARASTDFYMGKQLDVSLKGFASLPTVKEVIERMAKLTSPPPGGKGKPTKPLSGGAALMAGAIKEVEAFLAAEKKESLREQWITGKQQAAVAEVRSLALEKAKTLFSIVVGQVWFAEWKTLDENTMDINTELGPIKGTIEMTDVQVPV